MTPGHLSAKGPSVILSENNDLSYRVSSKLKRHWIPEKAAFCVPGAFWTIIVRW